MIHEERRDRKQFLQRLAKGVIQFRYDRANDRTIDSEKSVVDVFQPVKKEFVNRKIPCGWDHELVDQICEIKNAEFRRGVADVYSEQHLALKRQPVVDDPPAVPFTG